MKAVNINQYGLCSHARIALDRVNIPAIRKTVRSRYQLSVFAIYISIIDLSFFFQINIAPESIFPAAAYFYISHNTVAERQSA